MTSRYGHRYDKALYEPLAGRVEHIGVPASYPGDETALRAALQGIDLFHMHWPELLLGPEIDQHVRLIEILRDRRVRIVWTQHNLLPHIQHRAWPAIYQLWADAAQGVIHHSQWGKERTHDFRSYRPDAIHRVVRHGHWGAIRTNEESLDRDALARPYGMDPARTHLGVLGAPRRGKDLRLVVDGFLASDRDDLDLSIFSLADGETVPAHSRIHGRAYKLASRAAYNRRLAFIDVLVLPFRDDGSMLTTGIIGDVIGVAKPAIVSDWSFLSETFGDAAIVYGHDAEGLRRALDELDSATLDDCSDAMRALQPAHAWERSAAETLDLFERVLENDRG